jgi:DNA-binding CsgD family transcriptional regulator
MARASRSLPKQDEQAVPVTMGALHAYAQSATTLQDLTGIFAASIATDGFQSHFCFGIGEDGEISPLFGDAQSLPVRRAAGETAMIRPGHFLLTLRCWHEGDLFIGLGGRRAPVGPALRASLQGRAQVYATYGMALLERERDVMTGSGLGLAQRQCLARLLAGERDPQIAEALGITPLAVRGHIESAMKFLSARSRAEAVSLAARRGWLAGLGQEPDTLFASN